MRFIFKMYTEGYWRLGDLSSVIGQDCRKLGFIVSSVILLLNYKGIRKEGF